MEGIASVSWQLTGWLRLDDEGVTLELTGTRTTQQVSLDKIGSDVHEMPLDRFELPFGRISGAWLLGGWWRPRLELRTRSDDDLKGLPAVRGVSLALRVHRRDRELACTVASEIEARVNA
jgi:hypothetical protein